MIIIGYWRDFKNQDHEFPWPTEFYDPHWDVDEQEKVARYLDAGQEHEAYMGWSECRI
jgi:hypothetical protein